MDPAPPGTVKLRLYADDAVFLLRYCNWIEVFTQCDDTRRRRVLSFIQQIGAGDSYMEGDKLVCVFTVQQPSHQISETISDILKGPVQLLNLSKSLNIIQQTTPSQTVSLSDTHSNIENPTMPSTSCLLSEIDLFKLSSILVDLQEQ